MRGDIYPMTSKEKRIAEIMQKLQCSESEAIDILESDKAIDQGQKLFELSDHQKKVSKQARQIARKPTEQKNKAKKEDNDKRGFMRELVQFLETSGAINIELTNPERQVDFELEFTNPKTEQKEFRKHRLVFSAPRKKKE